MSVNAEIDGVVTPLPMPDLQSEPISAAPPEATAAPAAPKSKARRPSWIVPAAIAAVGLVVAGMLGYVLYTTIQQRDVTRRQLGVSQASLATANDALNAARSDAASRKMTADYVSLYVTDDGKVQTDYLEIVNCTDFSQCRSAAQNLLTDAQKFQADRSAATVPAAISSSDNSVRDALSALIAGDQEFITGIDNGDQNKAKDGGKKVDNAMLNLAKAQASLGSELR